MKENLLALFAAHPQAAIIISILLNVLIALPGILPSVVLTAANVLFFGFWTGTAVSFAGEAAGAVVSFFLYRKGFKRGAAAALSRYPRLQQLLTARGRRAFVLIFAMRLLPFVPAGLVTFAAAVGTVSATIFVLASSLGKIPALLIEAAAVQGFISGVWWLQALLLVVAAGILVWMWRKKGVRGEL